MRNHASHLFGSKTVLFMAWKSYGKFAMQDDSEQACFMVYALYTCT